MEVIYFLLATGIILLAIVLINIYGPCDKGGFHDWEEYNYKTGFVRDSGFSFPYKYCIDYRCRKCGKISKWRDK